MFGVMPAAAFRDVRADPRQIGAIGLSHLEHHGSGRYRLEEAHRRTPRPGHHKVGVGALIARGEEAMLAELQAAPRLLRRG